MQLNRQVAPQVLNATDFSYSLPSITHSTLPNGVPLYAIHGGAQEVLSIEIVFDAGVWHYREPAVAQAAMALLKNGTTTQSAFDINELLDYFGASLKSSASADFATITLSCMSKHVGQLLPLVYNIITSATFPESELALYKSNALQRMLVNDKKTDIQANRHIDTFLFGEQHPYGAYNKAEHINALTAAKLADFVSNKLQHNNCKIFLSGQYSGAVVHDLEKIFGAGPWQQQEISTPPAIEVQPALEKKHRISLGTDGVQGSIRLASPFVSKSHEHFVPMVIVNTLFGGYFGSRLMSNIREDKGFTYGIHSYLYNLKHGGAIGISTEVGKTDCDAAIAEVYNEMERMRNEPVGEEELQVVKNYLLGSIKGDLDGPFQIIQRWKNLLLFGFDAARFDANIETYKSITPEYIMELSNIYLQPERFYELVVV